MSGNWIPNLSYIVDNVDKVSAKDTNRPLKELDDRTQYLYNVALSSSKGENILLRNVTLDPLTKPGMPVYFDVSTSTYRPARVQVTTNLGEYVPDTPMYVRGIIVTKYSQVAGDILLFGRVSSKQWSINWQDVIKDSGSPSTLPGQYFLSSDPGMMTKSKSSHLFAYLGHLDSNGNFFFTPYVNASSSSHNHLQFILNTNTVTNTNSEGWAPVSAFEAVHVPSGAVRGYVIKKHPTLSQFFPPQPPSSAALYLDGAVVPTNLWTVNEYGIWWMSSDISPNNPNLRLTPSVYASAPHQFVFCMMHSAYANYPFVTGIESVTSDEDLPIDIETGPGLGTGTGGRGLFGRLFIRIRNILRNQYSGDESPVAVKRIVGVSAYSGPVISRIVPGNGISVQGTHGTLEDGYYGKVTISSNLASISAEGSPNLISMSGAVEDLYGNIPVIAFPQQRYSAITVRSNVPINAQVSTIRFVLDVIGVANTSVSLKVEYMRFTPGVVINTTNWVSLPNLTVSLSQQRITRVSTSSINILKGDTVYLRISTTQLLPFAIPILRLQHILE